MSPYFSHHASAGVLLSTTLAAWITIEIVQARKRRAEAAASDRGSLGVIHVCWIAAWIFLSGARAAAPGARIFHDAFGFGLGLVVAWAGIGLRWWSFKALGEYFTFTVMTSPDQPIVSDGPYSVLRHPGYAGAELAFIGLGVMYDNWFGLVGAAVIPMIGFLNRIRVEEAALSTALGDAYKTYASGRKRMIPFIW
jgi:protein-S-isoprenylcysteine O-methyltransferase Ste14